MSLDELRLADAARVKGALRRTWPQLAPYRRQMVLAVCLVIAWTGTSLTGPALIRYGIDHGVVTGNERVLVIAAGLYLAASGIRYLLHRTQLIVIGRIGESFLRDLRNRVFRHLSSLSLAFFDREKTGVLVSRMTSDVDSLSSLVQIGLFNLVSSVLLITLSLVVLLAMSPLLTAACLVGLLPVAVATRWFKRRSSRAYLQVQDRRAQTLSTLQESLSGVQVIHAFAREETVVDNFRNRSRSLFDAHLSSMRSYSLYFPLVEFVALSTTAAVLGFGGYLVHRDAVTIGTVVAFVLYLSNLFGPIQNLSSLVNLVQAASAGLVKLFGILDTRSELAERRDPLGLPKQGELRLERVSFAYAPGQPVLHEVDLTVAEGERIALVGPTGAGKSTLAKLATRLYDPTEGRVSFGGVDLRDTDCAVLRSRIVVLAQEGFLFSGSIRENVRLGRLHASDEEVEQAVKAVGIFERFALLPHGLDTEVNARGSRLSAGERQLVSLARAALADPAVIVLDEATSNLDPGTEQLVERALERVTRGKTVIVVAHRLSSAERADRVALVDGGRIVELGTHGELVARGGRYTALYRSWLGSTGSSAAA